MGSRNYSINNAGRVQSRTLKIFGAVIFILVLLLLASCRKSNGEHSSNVAWFGPLTM